eukprot:GILK01000851.1.p1 GENE.GILK01000851.1~~GILK01000851.1.p1  ORF type:complete len:296 (+),score=49.48 GILK01000851.1:116-1003(+)
MKYLFGADTEPESSELVGEQAQYEGSENNWGSWVTALKLKSGSLMQAFQHDLHEFAVSISQETKAVGAVFRYDEDGADHDARVDKQTDASTAEDTIKPEDVEQSEQSCEGCDTDLEEAPAERKRSFFDVFKDGVALIGKEVSQSLQELEESIVKNTGHLLDDLATPAPPPQSERDIRINQQIVELQCDPNTFTRVPQGLKLAGRTWEQYHAAFRVQDVHDQTESLMATHPQLRTQYDLLVPSVSESEFWSRYFYCVECIIACDEKTERAKRKEQQQQQQPLSQRRAQYQQQLQLQ